MILYHGSDVSVERPEIRKSARSVDFGTGFYTTSDLDQAQRWAGIVSRRNESTTAVVTMYEINDSDLDRLSVLRFSSASEEWLDYVVANRTATVADDWDLVIGPVANDQTMPTLGLYMRGLLTKRAAIENLLPQRLKDQYAFKSDHALELLTCRGVLR